MPETLTQPPAGESFADRLRDALHSHRPQEPQTATRRADAQQQCQDDDPLTCDPVGAGEYEVKSGECLSSIAKKTGRLWQTIWEHEANAELRETRKDPNVLATGDRLAIPPLRQRSEPGETEKRHRFVRIGQPTIFQLRLAHNGKPLANRTFTIKYDDDCEPFASATNNEGFLRCPMPSDARTGKLLVGKGEEQREYRLNFGKLEPVEHLIGVQQRLRNLGFYDGPDKSELDAKLRTAIEHFQRHHGVTVTGRPDKTTRTTLRERHGS